MKLTAKQERFSQAVAAGKSQSAAYREAYPRSTESKDATVWESASVLANNPKVATRIGELRKELADQQLWTRTDSVRKLREIALASESKPTDVIAAVRALNSMLGFNAPEKTDVAADARLAVEVCFGKSIGVADG